MPIMPDTRIFGDASPQQSGSPFQTLGSLMQIKEQQMVHKARQMEVEQKQRDYEDDMAIRFALQNHEDPMAAAEALRVNGRGTAGLKLRTDAYGMQTAQNQEQRTGLQLHADQLEMMTQILDAQTDDAGYQNARPQLIQLGRGILGPGVEQMFPTMYDEEKKKQLVKLGTSRANQIRMEAARLEELHRAYTRLDDSWKAGRTSTQALNEGAKKLFEGSGAAPPPDTTGAPPWSPEALKSFDEVQESLAREIAMAPNEAAKNAILARAERELVPPQILEKFRAIKWDPANPEAHKQAVTYLGMTVQQRAAYEDKAQAETAQAAARQQQFLRDEENLRRARAAEARAEEKAGQERTKFKQEQDDRAAAIAAGKDPNAKAPTARTENIEGRSSDAEYKEIEKWLKQEAGGTGYDVASRPGGYKGLPDETKKELERRLVESHNRKRNFEGRKPIVEAAREAKERKDRASYLKLVEDYKNVTHEIGDLEKEVPWPQKNAGVMTWEVQAGRRTRLAEIKTLLNNARLPAAERKELEQERADLEAARR